MRPTRWLPALTLFTAGVGAGLVIRHGRPAAGLELPDVDFHMMAIATRAVVAVEYGTASRVEIKAWERCALGAVNCGEQRTVEAICLGSGKTVLIDDARWQAFQRIPGEDLRGISGVPMDMQLCRGQGASPGEVRR